MIIRLEASELNHRLFATASLGIGRYRAHVLLVGYNLEDFGDGFDDWILSRESWIPWIRVLADAINTSFPAVKWIFMKSGISAADQTSWIKVLGKRTQARREIFLIICPPQIVQAWLAPVFRQASIHGRREAAGNQHEHAAGAPQSAAASNSRSIRAFVREHFDPNYQSRKQECDRLLSLIAAELGWTPNRRTVLCNISMAKWD